METLDFTIRIKATVEKVWSVLWEDETYKKWTTSFCEGSYAVSDWNEGNTIYFMSPDGRGMYSIIETKNHNEYMAFKHIGEIKDFKELPIDEETKKWSGARETYRLIPDGEFTVLIAQVDVVEKYMDYFKEAFPKGLEIVKQLSEA
ncbi:SRPBCC domain-containing protein [Flavobacterium sp. Fl-77]|uniref:SRPBCC domain-containing protein n=1 Tax=Flavobacterium flavipigmentatum TaxID=2893884 RepID=A0AAJ2SJK3_9FLAO|nr:MULTISPECIES: SRPBCC domain-containing protein [unclassified Flavobacterium]MDX6183896.1 SRPBCC domain-containing protein [Flavobacterium sp. Fl-33]MDX6187359.1 SRPBCC domain-containing protein [Flavobacterium sp. Fl-77]UFH40263.1 SRPBCC domain-containing protein [Flavobacterium sp. F-70]